MSYYGNNSSLATIHTTMGTGLLTALVTILYVLLTVTLVMQSKEAITVSNKAIAQSKTEHEVMYIQSRLEKLYYPLESILNIYQINEKNLKDTVFVSKIQNKIHEIIPYSYLASDNLTPCLNRFINIFNKNGTLIKELIKEAEKEKLEKIKQDEAQNEETVKGITINQKLVDIIPSNAWETLRETDIIEAADLYMKILRKINSDIEYYRNRLNDLTDSSKS